MGRRLVVNVRMLSFAHTMHHEATKFLSVTIRAETRECKRSSAPGEVPVKVLSDGGSTPPISTKKSLLEPLSKSKASGEDFFIALRSVARVFARINIGGFAALLRGPFLSLEKRITAFRVIFFVAGSKLG